MGDLKEGASFGPIAWVLAVLAVVSCCLLGCASTPVVSDSDDHSHGTLVLRFLAPDGEPASDVELSSTNLNNPNDSRDLAYIYIADSDGVVVVENAAAPSSCTFYANVDGIALSAEVLVTEDDFGVLQDINLIPVKHQS